MNPEEIAALKDLIEFLQEKKIGEFRLERGELKVELKFQAALVAAASAGQLASQFANHGPMDPLLLARLMGGAGTPAHPAASTAAAPAGASLPAPAGERAEEVLHTIKSPIVGTFYESPSPGSPPFVREGDPIEVGQPLCIVEAMKLMNEIESDVAGEIVKRLVQGGQPVEYGQPLFAVRPR